MLRLLPDIDETQRKQMPLFCAHYTEVILYAKPPIVKHYCTKMCNGYGLFVQLFA